MKTIKILGLLTLSFIFFSCCSDPPPQFRKNVVSSSVEAVCDGTTIYTIAYENGDCDNVKYGTYVKYQKGDTLYLIKYRTMRKGNSWWIVSSNEYYHTFDSINNIEQVHGTSYNKTIITK